MNKRMLKSAALLAAVLFVLGSCDLFTYGKLGGADTTTTYLSDDTATESRAVFDSIMSSLSGVWYSHYAGFGRLDGYRIGKWGEFDALMVDSGKTALFPALTGGTQNQPQDDDYFVFYDDTVYGQSDEGAGGNGGWNSLVTRYVGIVRAVNVFNSDPRRGAIIIEYLEGCAPTWDDDIKNGQRPFFGIYYRVLDRDTVQMANAVDLAALYNGEKYYTETKTRDEAIDKNTIENEAEFISWGVVIPQDREPR
jgi:hypothetical protein